MASHSVARISFTVPSREKPLDCAEKRGRGQSRSTSIRVTESVINLVTELWGRLSLALYVSEKPTNSHVEQHSLGFVFTGAVVP